MIKRPRPTPKNILPKRRPFNKGGKVGQNKKA